MAEQHLVRRHERSAALLDGTEAFVAPKLGGKLVRPRQDKGATSSGAQPSRRISRLPFLEAAPAGLLWLLL